MIWIQPCKGQVLSFILNGQNLTGFVHCIRSFESICKSYLTAEIIIYDNDNIIENLGIEAGTPGSLSFWSPPNTVVYNASLYVLKMKGEPVPDTLKFQKYYIDMIGIEFYNDRANTVRQNFSNMPATAAVAAIWGQYMGSALNVVTSSLGMIGSMNSSHTVANMKPLSAMTSILKQAMSPSQDGNWLLYHDNKGANLDTLTNMINKSQSSAQETFYQAETWGWKLGAGLDAHVYQAIIVAEAKADRNSGGRASGLNTASAAAQSLSVFDKGLGQIVQNGMNTITSTASNILGNVGISSKFGGKPNSVTTDSSRVPNATSFFGQLINAAGVSAAAKDGPQLALRVPMQTGLNCTVGKGVTANLIPPNGGGLVDGINNFPMSGNWLVTDICHEIWTDDREANATTNMQLVKGTIV